MPVNKNFLILLLLVHQSWCDYSEVSIDCQDDIISSDEDGVTDYHSFVTSSVKFYFLTPSNETIELNSTNTGLVNTSQPTKFLIHGLGAYQTKTWVDQTAYLYHTKGNYNVIAVDWSRISTRDKIFVVSALDSVGKVVGSFILDITEDSVEQLSDFHLIGSSVGAQIGGAAGEAVAKNGTKVGRITGLDPTVPEDVGILNQDDADFVDVIHTSVVYGDRKCGTVDFYVFADDPGHPVCANDTCGELLAHDFFVLSLEESGRFEAISCSNASDYAQDLCENGGFFMGEDVPRNVTGSYLVAKGAASALQAQEKYVLAYAAALIVWFLIK